MLTRSSVTSKSVSARSLGTKTFSEWSEDARSQDAPSQNVKMFGCQIRQGQGVDMKRNDVEETAALWTYITQMVILFLTAAETQWFVGI